MPCKPRSWKRGCDPTGWAQGPYRGSRVLEQVSDRQAGHCAVQLMGARPPHSLCPGHGLQENTQTETEKPGLPLIHLLSCAGALGVADALSPPVPPAPSWPSALPLRLSPGMPADLHWSPAHGTARERRARPVLPTLPALGCVTLALVSGPWALVWPFPPLFLQD